MTGSMSFSLTGGLVNSSQLLVRGVGTLDLGTALILTVTGFTDATDPGHFTPIATQGTSVIGSFSNFAKGTTVFTKTGTTTNYVINYGTFPGEPGNVVLSPVSPVPEPVALLGLAATALHVRRRRA